ncbi:aminodeoxychorismate synthase component I [Neolewinella agarilytica]|uniref:Aminodeoxychorismate synthase, subunit I n=1 Tax=Neolewinella agarilytica TaxID=478744 RepID=A0A1H8ZIG5_9BACT|nr:aminodeoxychorismate synthase component I [Neolewinella agarilytica]SEP64094.1 aminodeoxychorismate synthase, subunit I [Neolewinella agarilytica]
MSAITSWAQRLNDLGRRSCPCFFLMDFEQEFPRVWELAEREWDMPRFSFPRHPETGTPPIGLRAPKLLADHIDAKTFERAFSVVQAGLRRGDSFLTNLTFPVPVQLTTALEEIYWQSDAKYRILWEGHFVCFSPETFITIDKEGYIESRPMKGTALDTPAARNALLNSQKEIAEHATIVDLIRNDLSQVARKVRVTDYRYFHKIATSRRGLVQTSSKIGGQLPEDWKSGLGDILTKLLPAGSVSGAPKPATLDIIRRAEGQKRGYYCGIGGYFDGETVDTCVLIRFIEKTDSGDYLFRSGGGITARSDWEEEYKELKAKVRIPLSGVTFTLH